MSMTYEKLDAMLQGRNRTSRKLANNTYALRSAVGPGRSPVIVIRLHKTNIITFHSDGVVEVTTGGWQTVTTKDRLNNYLPGGWRVYSDRGVWYWHGADTNSTGIPFSDGDVINVSPNGDSALQAQAKPDDAVKTMKLRERVRRFAKRFAAQLPVGRPDAGDCFYCHLVDQKTGQPLPGGDHILSHVDEDYFVPSLLYNALKAAGAGDAWFWECFKNPDVDQSKDKVMMLREGRHGRAQVARFIARYCYRQLGLAR